MDDTSVTFPLPAAPAELRELVALPDRLGASLLAQDRAQALELARALTGAARAALWLAGRAAPDGDPDLPDPTASAAAASGGPDAPRAVDLPGGGSALVAPLRVALAPDGGGLARRFGAVVVAPAPGGADVAAAGARLALHVGSLLVERAVARRGGTDRVTGLLARPAFERGQPSLAARLARGEPAAVALLDLDDLRGLNAQGGPAAGDEALAAVGAAVSAVAGAPELACRWGGDEVLLVLPGRDEAGARAALAQVAQALAATPGPRRATFAAGLACAAPAATAPAESAPGGGSAPDLEALVQRADAALALAKREGPGAVVCWTPGLGAGRGRDRLAGVLTGAPARDYRNVQALLDAVAAVGRLDTLEATLAALLDRVVDVTGAERGVVLLRGPAPGSAPGAAGAGARGWRPTAARARGGASLAPEGLAFAASIADDAWAAGRAVHRVADDAATISPSADRLGVESVLCAPLVGEDVPEGVVYVDARDPRRFDAPALAFFDALVSTLATALRNAALYDRLRARADRLAQDVTGREAELVRVRRQLERSRPGGPGGAEGEDRYVDLVGASPPMRELFRTLRSLEGTGVPVVIEGESGTGKELVARAIHARSARAAAPLVAVNCGAIPEHLVESELFGHVKGAFTGAHADRPGLIEAAQGGTLFLDELGELPLDAQAKLLRFLESGEVRRVGAGDVRTIDVRVVAATNRDLKRAVAEGAFREDLWYRLAVFRLRLPPLRERPQDVPRLVEHLLALLGRPETALTPAATKVLLSRRWPGNVRELRNALERGLALAGKGPLDAEHVAPDEPEQGAPAGDVDLYEVPLQDARTLFSLRYARRAIERAGGSVPEAARGAGVSRQTFYRVLADGERLERGEGAAADPEA